MIKILSFHKVKIHIYKTLIILFNCRFSSMCNIISSYDTFNLLFSFQVPSNFFSHSTLSFQLFLCLIPDRASSRISCHLSSAIDRDPSRVGEHYAWNCAIRLTRPRDRSSCRSRLSISFLLPLRGCTFCFCVVLDSSRGSCPIFLLEIPVGSLFRDEKTLNDSGDRSWKSILMTRLFTDADSFLTESFDQK